MIISNELVDLFILARESAAPGTYTFHSIFQSSFCAPIHTLRIGGADDDKQNSHLFRFFFQKDQSKYTKIIHTKLEHKGTTNAEFK